MDLENSRNEILQERMDLLKEQVRLYADAVAEFRRLYKTKFGVIEEELGAIREWVATVAASRPGIPLPSSVDLDPNLAFEGLEDLGPIGGPDPMADMTISHILGLDEPAPVADEEIVGPDEADGSRS